MSGRSRAFARPLPGDGLVAQEGELSLVCAAPDAVAAPLVDALLTALRDVAEAGGDGAELVRRAARALAGRAGARPPACAVAGPSGPSGLAVLVSGEATARVMLADGGEVRVRAGAHGPSERTFEGPVASLELTLGGAGRAEPRLRLASGVVRGGGLRRALRRPAAASAPPADVPAAGGPRVVPSERLRTVLDEAAPALRRTPSPGPPVPGPPAPRPVAPARPTTAEPAPPPAPADGAPASAPGAPASGAPASGGAPPEKVSLIRRHPKRRPGGPRVLGVNCKNEHFNDPRAHYCAVCGISMLQLTLSPFHGPRPPLGVLLLDDGQAVPLEDDHLIGRRPERAPEVAEGRAHPLRMTDAEESISRRHVLVRLEEWQVSVVDLGSANGTAVRAPGAADFVRLPPGAPAELAPGATVRVGLSRTFRFESNRKV
ncbi:FHA domain-containing protein [Actinomadura sp. LD22]|uniref:FHA domain-containing protein n=1 Tax=Actinomadura physcomitrii TaxID=2650748 RepID=A0A6I4M8U2_9ACTN|nr:FHA domain-containing protein [Actinomadura physcomitrii]MWA00507.1 FHA domain-containing protein [Actinomadura physcomitrii]